MARNPMSRPSKHGQRGISLVLGMIMLVLMTLLAITAFQASNVNLRIAGNMQVRQETLAAAQTATEQVLSSPAFIDPATPPAAATVNLNSTSFTVNFTPAPACKSVVDLPSEDLVPTNPDDFVCIPSSALPGSSSGIFLPGSAPSAPSYCSNARWAVIADVADANTGARTTLEQGVAVRISKAAALTACPS
jgi:type IV pilus assembly PilX-like protein